MKHRKKNRTEELKAQKSFGFLDTETYFLAKEWLTKVYIQPARILKRRENKK